MAADIFGRTPLRLGGAFAADSAKINIGPFASGLITQNIQFSYQQPITRIYEVGAQLEYYIAGRPQGNASAARILGPVEVVGLFYTTFGNVCNPPQNLTFKFQAGCNGNSGTQITFTLTSVILQSVGMSVSAQDMIINEQTSFFFVSLSVSPPG